MSPYAVNPRLPQSLNPSLAVQVALNDPDVTSTYSDPLDPPALDDAVMKLFYLK